VRIAKVKSGTVHDVTPLLRVDRSPAWDPEGKYLYFISTRDFNPGLRRAAVRPELSAGVAALSS
jgi:tricorn protease-like protein